MAGISVSFIVYTFFRVVSCVYDIEIVMLRYVNKNKMFYTFFEILRPFLWDVQYTSVYTAAY